jgi:hypothetical protein
MPPNDSGFSFGKDGKGSRKLFISMMNFSELVEPSRETSVLERVWLRLPIQRLNSIVASKKKFFF